MSEWLPMERWPQCIELQRPGIVFELQNAAGQSLFTPCVSAPFIPADWTNPPVRFRAVVEAPPERSAPIPSPTER